MKRYNQLASICFSLLILLFITTACNNNDKEIVEEKSVMEDTTGMNNEMLTNAVATLSGTEADTTLVGTVEFMGQNEKVKMILNISIPIMKNKSVAVHLHEMGDCGDMGKNAHGHWNPTNQPHGKWGGSSFHSGDIGNIKLDGEGNGMLEMETDLWTIGGDPKTNILDKSVIVHSGMDDFTSQPSGNAGSRIGCGVIEKK
jgi:Cu-Zn family superoxide dismutase